MDGWVILRTAGRHTLPVAEHLASGGFEVWAPRRVFIKRAPRRKATKEITVPILPTFVFARSTHIHALLILAESPSKSCPAFSVFKHNGGVPTISAAELAPLRFIERAEAGRLRRERMKGKPAPIFAPGQSIRMGHGSFAGLSGIVESDDGRFAEVAFGAFKVKISTFLLRNDMALNGNTAVEAA